MKEHKFGVVDETGEVLATFELREDAEISAENFKVGQEKNCKVGDSGRRIARRQQALDRRMPLCISYDTRGIRAFSVWSGDRDSCREGRVPDSC